MRGILPCGRRIALRRKWACYTEPMERPRPLDTKTLRRLQGEAFLKGFTRKVLDPRVTDVLYDNPFALNEMAEGRLIIYKTPEGKDIVEYSPPVALYNRG